MSATFAARLETAKTDTVYPPGRGPHTSAEVIAAPQRHHDVGSLPITATLRNRTVTLRRPANFFRIKAPTSPTTSTTKKLDKGIAVAVHDARRRVPDAQRTTGRPPRRSEGVGPDRRRWRAGKDRTLSP